MFLSRTAGNFTVSKCGSPHEAINGKCHVHAASTAHWSLISIKILCEIILGHPSASSTTCQNDSLNLTLSLGGRRGGQPHSEYAKSFCKGQHMWLLEILPKRAWNRVCSAWQRLNTHQRQQRMWSDFRQSVYVFSSNFNTIQLGVLMKSKPWHSCPLIWPQPLDICHSAYQFSPGHLPSHL